MCRRGRDRGTGRGRTPWECPAGVDDPRRATRPTQGVRRARGASLALRSADGPDRRVDRGHGAAHGAVGLRVARAPGCPHPRGPARSERVRRRTRTSTRGIPVQRPSRGPTRLPGRIRGRATREGRRRPAGGRGPRPDAPACDRTARADAGAGDRGRGWPRAARESRRDRADRGRRRARGRPGAARASTRARRGG